MKQTNARLAFLVLCCVPTANAQVSGSGTKEVIPIWKGTTTLGNSPIVSVDGNVGIGTKRPSAKLDVETATTTGIGIAANVYATTGSSSAVFASTSAPQGAAITAFASSTTGNQVAISATTNSPTATAVFAHSTTTTVHQTP